MSESNPRMLPDLAPRRKTSKLAALIATIGLLLAPAPQALAQQEKDKGPPVIRDTEAEQLLRD